MLHLILDKRDGWMERVVYCRRVYGYNLSLSISLSLSLHQVHQVLDGQADGLFGGRVQGSTQEVSDGPQVQDLRDAASHVKQQHT